jgi:hypothetical protein
MLAGFFALVEGGLFDEAETVATAMLTLSRNDPPSPFLFFLQTTLVPWVTAYHQKPAAKAE